MPDYALEIEAAPHDWLFPRMRAVVHHGGAGTTAAGLRAGVPAQVLPFFGDQPYWGERIAALGVGPAPRAAAYLSAVALADAAAALVWRSGCGRMPPSWAGRCAREDGTGVAAATLVALARFSAGG